MVPLGQSPSQHVEHILPQKLSRRKGRESEWEWARRAPKKHLSLVNRYGNLLILEADINTSVSNYPFATKKIGRLKRKTIKCYADSKLRLAKKLLKWSDWSSKEISRRQTALARLAVRVWKIG